MHLSAQKFYRLGSEGVNIPGTVTVMPPLCELVSRMGGAAHAADVAKVHHSPFYILLVIVIYMPTFFPQALNTATTKRQVTSPLISFFIVFNRFTAV